MSEPDERGRAIEVYLNRWVTGKIPDEATQDVWRKFHSKWEQEQTTARGLAVNIYKGYSFAPVFDGRKTKDNFLYAFHIALDFDSKDKRSSLDYLAQQDYINWFASFAYTTPSHTDEEPRARVVWVFEEPIRSRDEYETLYLALLHEYPWADQSAKDAARFFYGSKGAEVWANWSIFPQKARDYLVEQYRIAHPQPEPKQVREIRLKPTGNYEKYVKAVLDGECDTIKQAADGERHEARFKAAISVGTLVGSTWAGLDKQTAVNALVEAAMRNTDTPRHAIERVIIDGIERGISDPRPEPQRTYTVPSIEAIL